VLSGLISSFPENLKILLEVQLSSLIEQRLRAGGISLFEMTFLRVLAPSSSF
jgi:hypothetical protein